MPRRRRQRPVLPVAAAILSVPCLCLVVASANPRVPPPDVGDRHLPASAQSPPTPAAEPTHSEALPDRRAVVVVGRIGELQHYPCQDCHGLLPTNPEPRDLYAPHPVTLAHGSGRMWCLDCHAPDDRDRLRTRAGESVSFDQAYRVCGQCHVQQQADWYARSHGSPADSDPAARPLYSCTHCHNAHAPAPAPSGADPT